MTTGKCLLSAMLATIVVVGLIGCNRQEVDHLKNRAASLEQELADTKAALAGARNELQDGRGKNAQSQTQVDALTTEATKCRVERDKLKQELAALKRQRQ